MKKLHLVPLLGGGYAFILGLGLLRTAVFGSPAGISWLRLGGGLVITGLGAWGVWDGVRDRIEEKSKPARQKPAEQTEQYIFTNAQGRRSSCVSRDELQAQLEALAKQSGGCVSLQLLPPRPVPGIGSLEQLRCFGNGCEKPLSLLAILQTEQKTREGRLKEEEPAQAAACLARIIAGSPEDFSGWTPVMIKKNANADAALPQQLLTLFFQERREAYRFFTRRDLELAIDGLAEGKYRRVELAFRFAAFAVFPGREQGGVSLRLTLQQQQGQRAFEKTGTLTQVKFWLSQMLDNGIPERLYGWQEVAAAEQEKER